MKLFIKQNRLTDIENKLMVTKRESGWGEINYGFRISKYVLLYIE